MRIIKNNSWQFFLVLFAPAILLAWGAIWLFNLYLKIEGIEEKVKR